MLTYNIFVFIVAVLLSLDYYMHRSDVHMVSGGTRLSFGNSFMYLALAVIIFFAGFRFEIGYDYSKYLAGYMFDDELKHWEPLFNFFVRIIREVNFGLEIQAMFLFYSTLTALVLYKALRSLTPHYRLGILFYVLVPSLYLNSFSVVRQGIALVILFYGLQYLVKEKPDYKKYIVVSFIAFMFHYSSLFIALLYLLGNKFFEKMYSWVLYTFLIVISLALSFAHVGKLILSVMPGHFSAYANMAYAVSPLKLLIINAFFLFFMLQKNAFIKNKLEKYLLNSIFIGLLIFNVFSDFVYVSRLGQYLLVAEIVLVPIYLYSLKDGLNRKIMLVLFLLYYLFNFNFTLLRDNQLEGANKKNALTPYRNYFFEEEKSYRQTNIEAWYNYIESTMNNSDEDSVK